MSMILAIPWLRVKHNNGDKKFKPNCTNRSWFLCRNTNSQFLNFKNWPTSIDEQVQCSLGKKVEQRRCWKLALFRDASAWRPWLWNQTCFSLFWPDPHTNYPFLPLLGNKHPTTSKNNNSKEQPQFGITCHVNCGFWTSHLSLVPFDLLSMGLLPIVDNTLAALMFNSMCESGVHDSFEEIWFFYSWFIYSLRIDKYPRE